VLPAHERDLQQHRVLGQRVDPARVGVAGRAEPTLGKSLAAAIQQRLDAELLHESLQLARRGRALAQVDEVGLDATLGEEAEGGARGGVLFGAEDLDFHEKAGAGDDECEIYPDYIGATVTDAPYRPAWWLPGRHARTIWGRLGRPQAVVPTRRESWETPDGDVVEIERLDAPEPVPAHRPRLLVLHGLEGTIRSHYIQGMLAEAQRRGWSADVLLFRSCGGSPNRARRFYHSGETGDLAMVVDRLATTAPAAPLVLAGFSLGGNVLLKYLGERGDAVPGVVRGAAAVSVPYDLARGAEEISRGFARVVYERSFLRSLKAKVEAKLGRYPDLVDRARLVGARSLRAFDDVVTAPLHGFTGADDYYARSSALGYLAGIRRPTLLLSARDDPFLPAAVLDDVRAVASRNSALEVEFVDRGGHVGFVAGAAPWRAEYYAERRVMSYLEAAARGPWVR